jgi:hypothetical protein
LTLLEEIQMKSTLRSNAPLLHADFLSEYYRDFGLDRT